MKIYTTKFNANEPTNKQINIPNFSTAKIGVQVEKNGQIVELSGSQINLVDGNTVISSDGNYNGFATFPITTGNENEDNTYILSCLKLGEIIQPHTEDIEISATTSQEFPVEGITQGVIRGWTKDDGQTFTQFIGNEIIPSNFKIFHTNGTSYTLPEFRQYIAGSAIGGGYAVIGDSNSYTATAISEDDIHWKIIATGEIVDKWILKNTDMFGIEITYGQYDWQPLVYHQNGQPEIRKDDEKFLFNLNVNSDKSTIFEIQ